LFVSDTYDEANKKANKALHTSDLNSDVEGKRKRRPNKRYQNEITNKPSTRNYINETDSDDGGNESQIKRHKKVGEKKLQLPTTPVLPLSAKLGHAFPKRILSDLWKKISSVRNQ